ncbi:MAG: hypothetical protein OEU76_08350 [Cyclobacteriaceae bacterium]|nr:hypothetical protein [Cyclobacteriaceae bacterium]
MKTLIAILLICCSALAQTISSCVPKKIQETDKFLFYLHGGVVTVLGNNAINQSAPEWGPYEYLNILDSLRSRGFNVISENRKEGVVDAVYVTKLAEQVDSLLTVGVVPKNILVVGASAGWNIAIRAAAMLKNKNLKFVIMGGCWPETYKEYHELELFGHFLSIIETTDTHGTCIKIFEEREHLSSYEEIKLNTGLSHGFIYKGYKEWIDPIVAWDAKY